MKISRIAWVLVFVLTSSFFLAASSAMAAVNAYLYIDGIKGESKSAQFNGWIAVESVMFNASPVTPRDAQSGMASGKRMHEPLRIMKMMDASSPKLMKDCTAGRHISKVEVVYVNSRGQAIKRILLNDVLISSVHKSGATAGGNHETEEVEFTYQKIELQSSNGKTMASDDWTKMN